MRPGRATALDALVDDDAARPTRPHPHDRDGSLAAERASLAAAFAGGRTVEPFRVPLVIAHLPTGVGPG